MRDARSEGVGVRDSSLTTHDSSLSYEGKRGLRTRRKRKKANGGCPGVRSRRRTRYTAKSVGEPCAGIEPTISEWGNPAREERVIPQGKGTRGTETSKYPEEKRRLRE